MIIGRVDFARTEVGESRVTILKADFFEERFDFCRGSGILWRLYNITTAQKFQGASSRTWGPV